MVYIVGFSTSCRVQMNHLAEEVWVLYQNARTETYVVQPSIPILYFGDLDAYLQSPIRIVTVGLNPSRLEFPNSNPFVRFPTAEGLLSLAASPSFFDVYLNALNRYFQEKPYSAWFDSFEAMLRGFNSSYYGTAPNTSLHTDLCSPLATEPTWSKLLNSQRARLEWNGVRLWHGLLQQLQPDIVLISVASKHLDKIQFAPLGTWNMIYKLERENPYILQHRQIQIGSRVTHLIFGQAAQKPFGTVSRSNKFDIGQALALRFPISPRPLD